MKLECIMQVKVLAKNKETVQKKDGSGVYKTHSMAFIQGSEMGVLSVPEEIYDEIVPDEKQSFIMSFYEGCIDGKAIKSFKIKGVVPFKPQEKKTVKEDNELPFR